MSAPARAPQESAYDPYRACSAAAVPATGTRALPATHASPAVPGGMETSVVRRTPRRTRRHKRPAPIPMHWWLPGAYASAPAVDCGLSRSMPAAIGGHLAHAGGFLLAQPCRRYRVRGRLVVSAALLWLSRRRAARPPPAESDPAAHPPSRRPGRRHAGYAQRLRSARLCGG
ncbi:hypothetical protein ACTMU2_00890 [Cupriavidus basilensis]